MPEQAKCPSSFHFIEEFISFPSLSTVIKARPVFEFPCRIGKLVAIGALSKLRMAESQILRFGSLGDGCDENCSVEAWKGLFRQHCQLVGRTFTCLGGNFGKAVTCLKSWKVIDVIATHFTRQAGWICCDPPSGTTGLVQNTRTWALNRWLISQT